MIENFQYLRYDLRHVHLILCDLPPPLITLHARRIESLEGGLQETKTALKEERSKFNKLKEDFKYNLRLLSERDAELARYDSLFAGKTFHFANILHLGYADLKIVMI